jgi:exodeoxyribonuclease VII small subunit
MAKKDAFETQLKRLEEIVKQLEGGQLPLEDSLRIFEEGVRLSRNCHEKLSAAERRVEVLLQEGGAIVTEPFTEALDDEDLPADPEDPE